MRDMLLARDRLKSWESGDAQTWACAKRDWQLRLFVVLWEQRIAGLQPSFGLLEHVFEYVQDGSKLPSEVSVADDGTWRIHVPKIQNCIDDATWAFNRSKYVHDDLPNGVPEFKRGLNEPCRECKHSQRALCPCNTTYCAWFGASAKRAVERARW